MLLAVEGGGFFSSSALGYSKGLTLLILGPKTEEKLMRVTPWNQYQLVDQEPNLDLQLASSRKNRLVHRCASFICFGRATTGLESQQQDVLERSHNSKKVKDIVLDPANDANGSSLRSSLKRSVSVHNGGNDHGHGHTEGRKVQWTDVSGGELFDVREFEPSEHSGSDDEFENGNKRKCSCRIL